MKEKTRRLALINPKSPLSRDNSEINEIFERNRDYLKLWYAPPLSLLTIASYTPKDIEIKIIDEHYEEINFDEEFELIGITAMTQQANRAYEIANEFKRRNRTVVMGGIHSSVLPDEALKHVDTVFIGESEELWPIYLKDLAAGNEKKLYKNTTLFDLKKSITPNYELINYDKYNKLDAYFKFLPVQATRGCPHDCSFCVTTKFYGSKIRKKDIDQIVTDIQHLQKHSNNSLLLFVDDNFFVDRRFSKSLLKRLIPLKIKYIAQSDAKVAEDEELLKLAYLSGCVMIFIGFESLNPGSLSAINANAFKMKQYHNYANSIKKIQENGIVVFGAFVIGFKDDDLSTFHNIKDFVVKNKIPGQFTLLTPLPGSRIYDEFYAEGRLIEDNFWNNCSFFSMTFKHDHLTKKEAESAIVNLHNEVFNEENTFQRSMHMMKIYKNLPPRWKSKD